MTTIGPQPGPQETFLATPADVAFYGGGAGGGKTYALLLDPLRAVHIPGFNAVIFRRTYPEIKQGGGLWDTSLDLYPALGGRPNIADTSWTFDCRGGGHARIAFRHLQHEATVYAHQGGQYGFIGFDELTHFSLRQFMYLLSRNRTTCGVKPWARATLNPDPDSWVFADFLRAYIGADGFPLREMSGKVRHFGRRHGKIEWADDAEALAGLDPLSFTFVPAKIDDNPALMAKDAGYKAKLNAMLQHERDRLLLGNWNAREAAGGYFPRDGWRIVELVRRKPGAVLVRGWDRAATEPGPTNPDPDWTCGVLIQMDVETNEFSILDVERFRLGPLATRKRIIATAQSDGTDVVQVVNQDPGAAGKTEVADLIRALAGFVAVPWTETGDKLTRARPLAVQQQSGNLAVPSGAAWLPDFVRELEAAGGPMPHDDQMDAASTAFNYMTSNYVNPGVD